MMRHAAIFDSWQRWVEVIKYELNSKLPRGPDLRVLGNYYAFGFQRMEEVIT